MVRKTNQIMLGTVATVPLTSAWHTLPTSNIYRSACEPTGNACGRAGGRKRLETDTGVSLGSRAPRLMAWEPQ